MIVRDMYGIIIQHRPDDKTYADGGDSARATGLMAFAGSELDVQKLDEFVQDTGDIVRHPYQPEYFLRELTSRDQVICFVACGKTPELKKAALYYAKQGKVNKDILSPMLIDYLYDRAGRIAPWWIRWLAAIERPLAMLWNTKIKPDHEMNQFICVCAAKSNAMIQELYDKHPDLFKNIRDYFNGWRNQEELGKHLINAVKIRVKVKIEDWPATKQ